MVQVVAGVSSSDAILVTSGLSAARVASHSNLPVVIWTHVERHGDPIIGEDRGRDTSSVQLQIASELHPKVRNHGEGPY